ncbi:MAG TPA: LEA type 2 family protein [Myxococcota bacterium]
MKRFVVAAMLAVVVAGCSFTKPSLTFKSARIHDTDLEGTTLDVTYEVKNPNSVGVSVDEVSYELDVEDHKIIAGQPPNGLSVAANGTSELMFPAKIYFAEVAPVVEVFLTQDTAKYRVAGELGIKTPVGMVRLPLSYEGTFPVPKLPHIDFENPRIESASLTGAKIMVPLKITNKNAFAIPLGALKANISLDGAQVATTSAALPKDLGPNETATVDVPVEVDLLKSGPVVAQVLKSKKAMLKLDGELKLSKTSIPIKLEKSVAFH